METLKRFLETQSDDQDHTITSDNYEQKVEDIFKKYAENDEGFYDKGVFFAYANLYIELLYSSMFFSYYFQRNIS